ncbi:MAG: M24 family metallopeptidase [bacterium]
MASQQQLTVRHERFQGVLGETIPDVVLIIYSRNRLYFSDTVRPGILVLTPNSRTMFSTRAHDMAQRECTADEIIEVSGTGQALEQISNRFNPDTVGLERRKIPAAMEDRIVSSLGSVESTDVTADILETRSVKDEFELEKLRRAGQMSNSAHKRVRECLEPGMEEVELAAEAESAARAEGHEGIMTHNRFDAYLPYGLISSGTNLEKMGSYAYVSHGSGPTRAFPVSAGHREIERGDPVVVDIGGVHYGYNSDISRTYVAGDSSDKLSRAHEILKEIYKEIESVLRAGNTPDQVYNTALRVASETPLSEYFQGHGDKQGEFVGHGIGLEIDEPPVLSKGVDQPLKKNNVVTIEIFFVFPGEGGVKIEESCIVTEEQPELLSSIPRELYKV